MFSGIKALVFDVDGVFTNGQIFMDEDFHQLRYFHEPDFEAIKEAISAGFIVGIITSGSSNQVHKVMQDCGIINIYLGALNKSDCLEDFCISNGVSESECLYMGDNYPDIEPLEKVKTPCCPINGIEPVKKICKYVSEYNGGNGCVADVIYKVIDNNKPV